MFGGARQRRKASERAHGCACFEKLPSRESSVQLSTFETGPLHILAGGHRGSICAARQRESAAQASEERCASHALFITRKATALTSHVSFSILLGTTAAIDE